MSIFKEDKRLGLDHFLLERENWIGWGGQGKVYEGQHRGSGLRVALKEVHVDEYEDEYGVHITLHGHEGIVKALGHFVENYEG